MSETKHTPGPWEAIVTGEEKHIIEYQTETGSIACIAQCMGTSAISAANAALIAAAPELLETLKELANLVEADQRGDDDAVPARWARPSYSAIAEAVNEARAAIAKAKGGAL